jgi:hypothetical protein
MGADIKMAPQEVRSSPGPGPQPKGEPVDDRSVAHSGHPSTERAPVDQDRPHACNNGWITLGQIALDDETGEEVEEFAMYLCRRCSDHGEL